MTRNIKMYLKRYLSCIPHLLGTLCHDNAQNTSDIYSDIVLQQQRDSKLISLLTWKRNIAFATKACKKYLATDMIQISLSAHWKYAGAGLKLLHVHRRKWQSRIELPNMPYAEFKYFHKNMNNFIYILKSSIS